MQAGDMKAFSGTLNFDNMDIRNVLTLEFQWIDDEGITQSERFRYFNREYLLEGDITISDLIDELELTSIDDLVNSSETYEIIIDGKLSISENISLGENFQFKMKPGSSISIEDGAEISFMQTSFIGCSGSTWEGIKLKGDASLSMCQTLIGDASVGLESLENSVVSLDKSVIKNCTVGLRIENQSIIDFFQGNEFIENSIAIQAVNCTNYLNLATDDYNFKNTFTDNTFGIVLNNSSGNVTGNSFNGGVTGLVVGNSDMTNIGGNEFGIMLRAIDIVNSDFVTLRWNDICY